MHALSVKALAPYGLSRFETMDLLRVYEKDVSGKKISLWMQGVRKLSSKWGRQLYPDDFRQYTQEQYKRAESFIYYL